MGYILNQKDQKKIYKKTGIYFDLSEFFVCEDVKIEAPSTLKGVDLRFPFRLGAFTHINNDCCIQNCTIGRYCAIGTGVKIGNGEHPTNWLSVNACQYIRNFKDYFKFFENKISVKDFDCYKYTFIGNDVWIGANVFIKDGITIGDGAIIGANSVVTHDVEPYTIVAGTPARVIRKRFPEEIIKQLQELKWWEYNITEFGKIDFDDIELAIKQLKVILPKLKKYEPLVVNQDYLRSYFPSKVQLLGLWKTYKFSGKKIKTFCGIKVLEKDMEVQS